MEELKFKTGLEWLTYLANTNTSDSEDEQFIKYICIQLNLKIHAVTCGLIYLNNNAPPTDIHSFSRTLLKQL